MVKIDRTQLHFREGKLKILNKKAVFDGLEQLTTTTITRHTDLNVRHNKLQNIFLQITILLRRYVTYRQTFFWSALPIMTSLFFAFCM
jgi:hypothetical protein